MKKTQLIIGIISLALAALLFSLRVTKIVVFLADGTATIYPAIGLAILGGSASRKKSGSEGELT